MARRVVVLLAVVFFALATGCADEEPSPTVGPTPTSAGAASTTAATGVAPAQEIAITVAAGKVTGGGRHKVARGSTVRIVVTADVSDEVHLHGYDKKVDVTPAAPATIEVVASIPGVFEIELEKQAKKLADLEVT